MSITASSNTAFNGEVSNPSPTTSNPHPGGALSPVLGVLCCCAGLEQH